MKKYFWKCFFLVILVNILLPVYSQNIGIECNIDQLYLGNCKFSIYKVLGIKQSSSQEPPSVGLFLQDIVLSATFFIGTIVTVAIIISGFLYIRSGITGNDNLQGVAKKGLRGGFVGLILVMSSYVIVRLIQFIIRGG